VGGQKKHEGHFGEFEKYDRVVDHYGEIPTHGFKDKKNNTIINQTIEFKTIIIITRHIYHFPDGTDVANISCLPNVTNYGENIKALVVYFTQVQLIPVERMSELLRELSEGKINISQGTIINFIRNFSNLLNPTLATIKEKLKASKILHFDETSVSICGKNNAVQGYTNGVELYLPLGVKKCNANILEFLNECKGLVVVDYCKYYQNTSLGIVQCNAHICRYLKRMHQEFKISEAKELRDYLLWLLSEKNRGVV
jgi:Mor family transcriptional regulator